MLNPLYKEQILWIICISNGFSSIAYPLQYRSVISEGQIYKPTAIGQIHKMPAGMIMLQGSLSSGSCQLRRPQANLQNRVLRDGRKRKNEQFNIYPQHA